MANNDNLKPFGKGYDPRRNLKGVPAEAIAARKLIRKIGAELIHIREKNEAGEVIDYDITRAEAMIRLMFGSRQPKDKEMLMKALWPGLLKNEWDITSGDKPIGWKEFISGSSSDPDTNSE